MISFTRYVDITSGVGAGAGVRLRDLIARLFTTSLRLPPASFAEFDTAADVGAYFGTTSPEYKRAVKYFGFINKNIAKPNKISFARYVDTAVAPRVFGTAQHATLANLKLIVAGTLDLTLGGTTTNLTAISFAAAVDLAGVAALLQTKIQAYVAGGLMWTAATVTFDPATNSFNIVGGQTVAGDVSINFATAGSIGTAMGWNNTSAIFADGAIAQSALDAFTTSFLANNNFATFGFIPTLVETDIEAIILANKALNNEFLGIFRAPDIATMQAWYAMWAGIGGCGFVLAPIADEYPDLLPMSIAASTDYNKRNSVQNYMFQQDGTTPTVTSNEDANAADAVRLNYVGRTMRNGQNIDFFQRGVLLGLPTDPVDMNVYVNEIWLKDLLGSEIMRLLLALARVSANATGRSQLIAVLMANIGKASFNGTISVGKPLDITQQLFVSQQTGDSLAWYQVQSIGFWLDCNISSYVTVDSRTEWKATYTLIYSKDDAIRKVEGSHVLI